MCVCVCVCLYVCMCVCVFWTLLTGKGSAVYHNLAPDPFAPGEGTVQTIYAGCCQAAGDWGGGRGEGGREERGEVGRGRGEVQSKSGGRLSVECSFNLLNRCRSGGTARPSARPLRPPSSVSLLFDFTESAQFWSHRTPSNAIPPSTPHPQCINLKTIRHRRSGHIYM